MSDHTCKESDPVFGPCTHHVTSLDAEGNVQESHVAQKPHDGNYSAKWVKTWPVK